MALYYRSYSDAFNSWDAIAYRKVEPVRWSAWLINKNKTTMKRGSALLAPLFFFYTANLFYPGIAFFVN
jgi:hypothetical protein